MRRWPRASAAVGGLAALGVLAVVGSNAYILLTTSGGYTGEVSRVPKEPVAIVPGALVQPNGKMSAMLADRVEQASRLWHAGKVEKILVSGDHHTWAYDEPDTMRKQLVRDGVPPQDVFEDHAGFDTWATMVRARSIFGIDHAVVVTQGFHMPRALFLAEEAGIDATGLTADLHHWGYQGRKSEAARSSPGSRRSPTSPSTRRRWPARGSRSRPPTAAKAGGRNRRPGPRLPGRRGAEPGRGFVGLAREGRVGLFARLTGRIA